MTAMIVVALVVAVTTLVTVEVRRERIRREGSIPPLKLALTLEKVRTGVGRFLFFFGFALSAQMIAMFISRRLGVFQAKTISSESILIVFGLFAAGCVLMRLRKQEVEGVLGVLCIGIALCLFAPWFDGRAAAWSVVWWRSLGCGFAAATVGAILLVHSRSRPADAMPPRAGQHG